MSASRRGGAPTICYRPIYGGVFGKSGQYVMATMPCIERGLHSVRFMVVHPSTGRVLSVGSNQQEALSGARRLLRVTETLIRQAANDSHMHQAALWPDADLTLLGNDQTKPKVSGTVPKRRREVFERSDGKCFYCGTSLVLDGKWHIEHQMPRALMGADELPNLVSACVACNLAKGDRTALEFMAATPNGSCEGKQ